MNFIAVSVMFFAAVPSVMSDGVRVKAALGGNATINCFYQPGSENYPKYFSKGRHRTQLVRRDNDVTRCKDTRFSLEDDKMNRVFTVTVRNLTVDDAGLYWCAVDNWFKDTETEVNLDVVHPVVDDLTTENVTEVWQRPTQQEEEERSITVVYSDKPLHLGITLAAVLLLFGITSALFLLIKYKTRAASTASENITKPDVEYCTYAKILSTDNTTSVPIQSPDRIYATVPDCKPAARSGGSALPHPETVVYSSVLHPPQFPVYSTLSSPSQPAPKFYSEQKTQMFGVTSASSQVSHDVYSTVQRH